MSDQSFMKVLKEDFDISFSNIEIMEYQHFQKFEHHLRVRVYWKLQTVATKPLRQALQGMKE